MDLDKTSVFTLNNWQVDVTRCQIINGKRVIQLEPKVMDVLYFLAKHQGKVLSQEEIFAAVWPKSVYSPGSLQRCILQLRKALGENAQNAQLILTHAKRGYSLEAKVRKQQPSNVRKVIFSSLTILVILASVVFISQQKPQPRIVKTNFTELTPITSTEEYEFYSTFSPSGEDIAFIRATAIGLHRLWVKNLTTGMEKKVSAVLDNYHALAWHPSGQGILYAVGREQQDSLGFIHLTNKKASHLISNNSAGFISNLQWKKPQQFYYLCDLPAAFKKGCKGLYQYNWVAQQSQRIFSADSESYIEQMAVSPNAESIVMSIRKNNQAQVQVLNLASKQRQTIKVYDDESLEVNWHPDGQHLLITHSNQLELVSLSGQSHDIEFNNYLNVYYSNYNPDGNELTLTLSKIDQDIVEVNLNDTQQRTVINSSSKDTFAQYSPNNQMVVFVSYRAGYAQVFIKTPLGEKVVFENAAKKPIFAAPAWSHNSEFIAFVIDKEVLVIDLKGTVIQQDAVAENAYAILDWYHHENALLIGFNDGQQLSLAKLALDSGQQQILPAKVDWAHLDNDDNLLMLKGNKLLRGGEGINNVLVAPKETLLRFTLDKDRVFYQTQSQKGSQIWQYSNNQSSLIFELAEQHFRLQDVHDKSLLLTTREQYDSDIVLFK